MTEWQRQTLAICVAAALLCPAACMLPPYEGVGSFINNFDGVEPADYPGGTFRLVTGDTSLGLGMSGASVLLFTLEPCTILQPHIHPHPELAFPIKGKVTFSVVYNNQSFTGAIENTKKDVGPGGYASFPTGTLHVTQNEGCTTAEIMAVFLTTTPDTYFYPLAEGSIPANTLASYFGGKVTKEDTQLPLFTAPLAGCSCDGGSKK